jgi:Fe-S-cluster-containing dehydrogenase component
MILGLRIREGDCVGCHVCEVACKQEHDLPPGADRIRILERTPRFEPIYCRHCFRPPCLESCPTGAIKREKGIVFLDKEKCIGCKACMEACPFGAMGFDAEKGVAEKCDLCFQRTEKGERPACVSVCPARCMEFGDLKRFFSRSFP